MKKSPFGNLFIDEEEIEGISMFEGYSDMISQQEIEKSYPEHLTSKAEERYLKCLNLILSKHQKL